MSPRSFDLFTLVALASLLVFGGVAWQRRFDAASAARYGSDLRSLLALEHRLTGEVLKARSRSVGHYDGIVQAEAALRRVLGRLSEPPRFLPKHDRDGLGARLALIERDRVACERLVELFKRENSVLRNSLRYLPVAASESDALARTAGGQDLAADVDVLVRDVLLLQSFLDPEILARVDAALARLQASARVPGEAGAPPMLASVLAHARVVRQRTPVVSRLTTEILALPTTHTIEEAFAAFVRGESAARRRAEGDSHLEFALAVLALFGAASSIIVRLRRSTRSLREASSRLAQVVDALRVEQAKQKELSDLKSKFVSMTSHEFRTPVSVIVSSSEMLEAYADRWSDQRKAEHLARILAAARSMTNMLDAILLIGRSDAGMLRFEPRLLDVDELCQSVIADVAESTKQGGRVVFDRPNAAGEVVADESLLKHILENLLSNALKYSDRQTEVTLAVSRADGELSFTVRDRGIGIPEPDRLRLFETFHRGSNVGKVAGTGLGLAIVKRAVDLHGGRVQLQSAVGRGTTFVVTIPCEGAT